MPSISALIRAPSSLRSTPATRKRQFRTRSGRSGFFDVVVIDKIVVVIVDAQVEQKEKTVLDGID